MRAQTSDGRMATSLVKMLRVAGETLISKKPSITNWPASVPVIVDDCQIMNEKTITSDLTYCPTRFEKSFEGEGKGACVCKSQMFIYTSPDQEPVKVHP